MIQSHERQPDEARPTIRPKEAKSHWRAVVAPFERSRLGASVWQLINTFVPFVVLWSLAYWSLSVSYWLLPLFVVPAGAFLVRIFIIFHDCCHGSFFRNKRANAILGTITGILTFVPYRQWKHSHSVHHATSGNLDKRGTGDIWTLTADEYLAAPKWKRAAYRIYRNPFVMFGLGPIFVFLLDYRFNRRRAGIGERINTYVTNLGIVGLAALTIWLVGWEAFLLIQGPIFFVSGAAGIWLFYVQHQFEHTYFELDKDWEYLRAALDGSSYYKLPKVLHFLTGNIGYHHIHHLSPRVPNYHLPQVHQSSELFKKVPAIGIRKSLESLRYRVWDEQAKRFLSFRELRLASKPAMPSVRRK